MPPHIPLTAAPLGSSVRIRQLHSRPETSTRLRELGLCEDAVIRCLHRSHGNMICEVLDSRIGLNERTAELILVDLSLQD